MANPLCGNCACALQIDPDSSLTLSGTGQVDTPWVLGDGGGTEPVEFSFTTGAIPGAPSSTFTQAVSPVFAPVTITNPSATRSAILIAEAHLLAEMKAAASDSTNVYAAWIDDDLATPLIELDAVMDSADLAGGDELRTVEIQRTRMYYRIMAPNEVLTITGECRQDIAEGSSFTTFTDGGGVFKRLVTTFIGTVYNI